MSIIAHAPTNDHDEFATQAVINILRRESAVFEDNLRRGQLGASRDAQQRIVNRIHALINTLTQDIAQPERTEVAA